MKSFTLGPLSLLLFTLQQNRQTQDPVSVPLADVLGGAKQAAGTHVVVSGRPARVQLGVDESLLASHLVIFGLFFFGQRVPLRRGNGSVSGAREL